MLFAAADNVVICVLQDSKSSLQFVGLGYEMCIESLPILYFVHVAGKVLCSLLERGRECLQVCRSDQDVKSALQAWCAYGQPGSMPADMFKQANPLRQAFASSMGKAVATVDGGCGRDKQHRQVSRTLNLTVQHAMCIALAMLQRPYSQ